MLGFGKYAIGKADLVCDDGTRDFVMTFDLAVPVAASPDKVDEIVRDCFCGPNGYSPELTTIDYEVTVATPWRPRENRTGDLRTNSAAETQELVDEIFDETLE